MTKTKIKELIVEEVKNQNSQLLQAEISKISLDPGEVLIFTLKGDFTSGQYTALQAALDDRFGKSRCLVMGMKKEYNIEITKGKFKDGE